VTHRAGLAGQAAAGATVATMSNWPVRLAATIGCCRIICSTGRAKYFREFLVVDGDLAGAGLDPDAGDGVLALAGGIGAALLVELLDVDRGGGCATGRRCRVLRARKDQP
jgi:hypothetical protein